MTETAHTTTESETAAQDDFTHAISDMHVRAGQARGGILAERARRHLCAARRFADFGGVGNLLPPDTSDLDDAEEFLDGALDTAQTIYASSQDSYMERAAWRLSCAIIARLWSRYGGVGMRTFAFDESPQGLDALRRSLQDVSSTNAPGEDDGSQLRDHDDGQ